MAGTAREQPIHIPVTVPPTNTEAVDVDECRDLARDLCEALGIQIDHVECVTLTIPMRDRPPRLTVDLSVPRFNRAGLASVDIIRRHFRVIGWRGEA